MTDETLLTAAKLHEQATGGLDGDVPVHDHVGLVDDDRDRDVLSFVEATGLDLGSLGDAVRASVYTRDATAAVAAGDANTLSAYVGVTDSDMTASALRLPVMLLDALENGGAPAFPVAAGNPNTGKTNTMLLLSELRRAAVPDLRVLANFDSTATDVRVTSAHDLAVELLKDRQTPKWVTIDESSTHFDARTYRKEVAQQWTPLAKRFAKLHVDACGLICHTGKDLHPEGKRMATLPFYKSGKKTATFFEEWPADADHPREERFGGSLDELEKAASDYSPDDAAPWSWNLRPELFSKDLGWSELLDELRERGPASTA